jgi:hypothetical protein
LILYSSSRIWTFRNKSKKLKTASTSQKIRSYLESRGKIDAAQRIEFLAAGEYKENHPVLASSRLYVFRISHGLPNTPDILERPRMQRYSYNTCQIRGANHVHAETL